MQVQIPTQFMNIIHKPPQESNQVTIYENVLYCIIYSELPDNGRIIMEITTQR